jgi:hypothetical protein
MGPHRLSETLSDATQPGRRTPQASSKLEAKGTDPAYIGQLPALHQTVDMIDGFILNGLLGVSCAVAHCC